MYSQALNSAFVCKQISVTHCTVISRRLHVMWTSCRAKLTSVAFSQANTSRTLSCMHTRMVPAPTILHSYDHNIHVEGLLPVNLC